MPSDLAHLRTRFWKSRLMASATPSAFCLSCWAPNGSSMELDSSTRKRKHVGLVRLISVEYGKGRRHGGGDSSTRYSGARGTTRLRYLRLAVQLGHAEEALVPLAPGKDRNRPLPG